MDEMDKFFNRKDNGAYAMPFEDRVEFYGELKRYYILSKRMDVIEEKKAPVTLSMIGKSRTRSQAGLDEKSSATL